MEKISYKDYVWPQNPHTYCDSLSREPRYTLVDEDEFFAGMSLAKRTITGKGVFFGPDAYEWFRKLTAVFADATPGDLVHPVWGRCYCYLTDLRMAQEPKENYVSYEFTFTGALPNGDVPK